MYVSKTPPSPVEVMRPGVLTGIVPAGVIDTSSADVSTELPPFSNAAHSLPVEEIPVGTMATAPGLSAYLESLTCVTWKEK
jgi:hypothetical protein